MSIFVRGDEDHLKTSNARIVIFVCDRQRIQKTSAELLLGTTKHHFEPLLENKKRRHFDLRQGLDRTEGHATDQHMKQEVTSTWEAQQNHLADQARLIVRCTEDQHLIARIRAHILFTIKKVMEINKEQNLGDFLNRRKLGNETVQFKVLPQPRAGRTRTLNRKTATQTTI